jgi:hypothetical protein
MVAGPCVMNSKLRCPTDDDFEEYAQERQNGDDNTGAAEHEEKSVLKLPKRIVVHCPTKHGKDSVLELPESVVHCSTAPPLIFRMRVTIT